MIFWLEDRIDTVSSERAALLSAGADHEILPSPKSVMFEIESGNIPKAFIVDIMLHGINDLGDIGVSNAPTLTGNHAGFVFADRVLRSKESKLNSIPVCFLTERTIEDALQADVDYLNEKGPGPVRIFKKYSQKDLDAFITCLREWGLIDG